ncbi:hypothetical protein ACU8KH_03614 [Lachancea thermotolerans]
MSGVDVYSLCNYRGSKKTPPIVNTNLSEIQNSKKSLLVGGSNP